MAENTLDPKSSATTGYHLFWQPTGELAAELGRVIGRLAGECGGPLFTPHVTLLARIPEKDESVVIGKAKELASTLSPTTFTLGVLASEDAYFRALYSRIEEQEEASVRYKKACEVFSMQESPDYLAHLSLLYGNFAPESLEEVRESVVLPEDASFVADTLHLYRTEGVAGQWYKVQEFPLGA